LSIPDRTAPTSCCPAQRLHSCSRSLRTTTPAAPTTRPL
jgi:hypothetical protein